MLKDPKPVFLLLEPESALSVDLELLPKSYEELLDEDPEDDPDDDFFCDENPLLNDDVLERLLLAELACASLIPATDTAAAIASTIIRIIATAFICIIFFPTAGYRYPAN